MRLNRDQVLTGALGLLDEVGLDQLTMRRLAAALDVQNGATYWHFTSKQALLEAMADAMLDGLTAGLDERLPWQGRVAELARRLRRALLAHRDGARIFTGAFFPLPNALAYGEAMIAALREGGLSSRDAAWAADTITYYVAGHAIEDQLAASLPDRGRSAATRLTGAVDRQRHPHLAEALAHIPAPHQQEHFEHGLDIIIGGIRASLDQADGQAADQAHGQAEDQAHGQAEDQAANQTGDQAADQDHGQAADQAADRPEGLRRP